MTEILIIRHGQTPWNVKRWVQGWTNTDLNDTGRAQAQELAHYLGRLQQDPHQALDGLYSSDLNRAMETARIIDEQLKLGVQELPGVRERRYGVLEGVAFDRLFEDAPREAEIWHSRDPDGVIEGAETLRAFQQRIVTALNALAQEHPDQRVAVVTHGGAMDIIWRESAGIDLEDPQRAVLLNASINRIRIGPKGWELLDWGNINHLEKSSDDDVTA